MNDLDWVLFMGTAHWTKARLYQWHEKTSVWTRMEPAQNLSRYMDVLETITEDSADGIFSNVFCQVLFAQKAAIDTLQSQLIQITGAIFGGERFAKNGNAIIDNGASKTGFKLGADGRLTASNAEISGTISASDGEFTGSITPVKGIFNSWYWGIAVNKTQKDWFDIFEDRIPVGKRLNTFGGARLYNSVIKEWTDNVMSFIERIDNDTIEINAFPINTTKRDYLTIISCARENNNIVSSSFYFGW
jgi:hypothetical protein